MTKAVLYVEIDVDFCSRTYGTSPCTASVGTQAEIDAETATGLIKCYNTRATCQDLANFDNAPKTIRFCKYADFVDHSIEAIPSVLSFSYSPSIISLGEDLGQRASVKIMLRDHPHDDTGGAYDPYLADRTYIPVEQGTFWPKFRARQPYLRGRPLRLIQGTSDQALGDMETRTFEIESFEGPSRDGVYTLIAKDDLKRADGDRAVIPAASTGKLSSAITSGATSATLSASGVGDDEYPTSGYIAIGGKEIVSFTRSDDTLTIVRAQYNTTAIAHDAGERCQLCKVYTAVDPADLQADFAENGAGIDSAIIPLSTWRDETSLNYGRVLSACIPEPTPVKTLMAEVNEQCGMALWYDDLTPQLRLQVVRQISTDAEVFDDTKIIEGSFVPVEQPTKRITEIATCFGQINPLEGVKDPNNFRSCEVDRSTDATANNGLSRKEIFSRWIPFGNNAAASRVNAIMLARYKKAPRKFKFDLYRHDASVSPILGEGCLIETKSLQEPTGALKQIPAQILRVLPGQDKWSIEAEELNVDDLDPLDPNDRPITIDSDINDYDLPTKHAEIFGAPLNGSVVTLTIDDGVVVGSSNTSTPSLSIGDTTYWPTQAATGNTTASSGVISGLNIDAEDLLSVGMVVSGTGVDGEARITNIDSASQITVAPASSITDTGVSLTIYLVQIVVNNNGKVRGKGGRGGEPGLGDENGGGNGSAGGDALKTRYPIILSMPVDADIKSGGGGGGGGAAHYNWPWGPQYNGRGGGGGAGRNVGPGGSNGNAGTLDTGGSGISNGYESHRSGPGGAPGAAGSSSFGGTQAYGGATGSSVDGWSFVIEDSVLGTYAGGQVN